MLIKMKQFVMGATFACLFTTAEGRKIVESTSKMALKMGDKVLKNKLGIDMNAVLSEDETQEDKTNV